MPGRAAEPGGQLALFSHSRAVSAAGVDAPTVHRVGHGLAAPISRVAISWSRGNTLAISYFSASPAEDSVGGSVVELDLSAGGGGDDEMRRIAFGSMPAFALLRENRSAMMDFSRMHTFHEEWWRHVMDYSKQILKLFDEPMPSPDVVIADPLKVLKLTENPSTLKAAWELLEMFYVDKDAEAWLPERLVDWLRDYDCLLSSDGVTIFSKLAALPDKLAGIQVFEDESEYWECISHALAVGWLDVVVELLRSHGSYQLYQLGNREMENGLVEAVAVLVLTMPRLRPTLADGKIGQSFASKPDFIKAWEIWRAQVTKLQSSTFWLQCDHSMTRDALRNLLQIMLGNVESLVTTTCHWMELYVAHFIHVRPFTVGREGMYALARKCMHLKQMCGAPGLVNIILAILSENVEVVLAECSKNFGPWMVSHAIELLTADNSLAEALLCEEHDSLGGISIEELYRLIYAQFLSSNTSTLQIAPAYLRSCTKHGFKMLEILLCKQPVHINQKMLKNLEICRLCECNDARSSIMKVAGVHHWKHGRKGSGVYWLQQAHDDVRLNKIAQKLFDIVAKPVSDEHLLQWEGLIELLGVESGIPSGLDFLRKYRDFKRSLQNIHSGTDNVAARQAVECLILLMKYRATPVHFWLPLLYDSLKLLNWRDRPLLNASETNLMLNKLQELSMARLRPDFYETELPSHALSAVRLALAYNLGRAIIYE